MLANRIEGHKIILGWPHLIKTLPNQLAQFLNIGEMKNPVLPRPASRVLFDGSIAVRIFSGWR